MQLAVFGTAGITSDALVLAEGSDYHAFACSRYLSLLPVAERLRELPTELPALATGLLS